MCYLKLFVVAFLACCAITSCSGSKEDVTAEKGSIEKLTDATADRVVNGINSSLDAARKAAKQVDADTIQKKKMLEDQQ